MKKFTDTPLYEEIVKNKSHVFFISPHLDDAIFSAGGLMRDFNLNSVPMTLVNIFTKSSKGPYSISAKAFLSRCGFNNAEDLFETRIKEDLEAATKVGAQVINLGFVDALWRRKGVTGLTNILSKYIPELDYVYPLFRFSLAYGKISLEDIKVAKTIEEKLSKLIDKKSNSVKFVPLAVGHHVDHVITRDVCTRLGGRIVYWTDYPYIKNYSTDQKFIKSQALESYGHQISYKEKEELVNSYKSQIQAVFNKTSESISLNETYYF